MINLATKTIRGNFFNFSEPEEEKNGIDRLFQHQQDIVNQGKVDNIEAGGNILRITFLDKKTRNSSENKEMDYWWVGILEKLDVTSEGEVANLDGKRTKYAAGPDEGTIVNTGFLYYPLTNTLLLHKKQGGVNDKVFGVFIRKLLKHTNISSRHTKYTMDVVPDMKKLLRLEKANSIKELHYSFALPKNMDSLKFQNRPILGDMYLANFLGGERIKVTISAKEQGMKVIDTVSKVKELLKLDSTTSLRATSEHGDITEPLDLLSDRFTDYINVTLNKNQKETATLIMDTLNQMFLNQKTLIDTMYINKQDE